MQSEHLQKGRMLLIAVTLTALALQAVKLGSRGVILHQWPTAGQWGQLALVVWLVMSLWDGKEWARVVSALYYAFAGVVGTVMLCLMWVRAETSLLVVSVLIVVLAGGVSGVLWLSDSLRSYMADRRAA